MPLALIMYGDNNGFGVSVGPRHRPSFARVHSDPEKTNDGLHFEVSQGSRDYGRCASLSSRLSLDREQSLSRVDSPAVQ
jgi:hypothetical protein